MDKILVILGPTTTGKTNLALHLAKKFNGELVACDSRQVYQGLDIGTGKMPSADFSHQSSAVRPVKGQGYWEIDEIKIWMYDVVSLNKQYTVEDYVRNVDRVIVDIVKRGKLPIIVGGTGLYLKALVYGLSNLEISLDDKLRKHLSKLNKEQLQEKLQEISPEKWDGMNQSDRGNPRRLIRAIELESMIGKGKSAREWNDKRYGLGKEFDLLKIGLVAPKEELNKKINYKVFEWVKEGIVDEVIAFIKKGIAKERISSLGLEYKIVVEYLDSKISLNQMIEKMQNKTRQYAKRQITWFKKEKDVVWFDITHKNYLKKLEKVVFKWYYSKDAKKN